MKRLIKLETTTERSCCDDAELEGIENIKIKKKGHPDRLFLIRNGYCFYVEFKRVGKDAEKLQAHIHKDLRSDGFHVYVCKSRSHFKAIMLYEYINHKSKKFKEYDK